GGRSLRRCSSSAWPARPAMTEPHGMHDRSHQASPPASVPALLPASLPWRLAALPAVAAIAAGAPLFWPADGSQLAGQAARPLLALACALAAAGALAGFLIGRGVLRRAGPGQGATAGARDFQRAEAAGPPTEMAVGN